MLDSVYGVVIRIPWNPPSLSAEFELSCVSTDFMITIHDTTTSSHSRDGNMSVQKMRNHPMSEILLRILGFLLPGPGEQIFTYVPSIVFQTASHLFFCYSKDVTQA